MNNEQDSTASLQARLQALYNDDTKHANYQNIPAFVRDAMEYREQIDEGWRGDTARYRLILDELPIAAGQVIGDVGANTGFFTLSLAHSHPETHFVAYETNPNHADFVGLIADAFALGNVVVQQLAVDLTGIAHLPQHDSLLHLNVLHHAGHDFDRSLVDSVDGFADYAVTYLSKLRRKTTNLVFQMGSNWGGDKATPIVPMRDDCGKIMLTSRLLRAAGWQVTAIALATHAADEITYRRLPADLLSQVEQSGAGETPYELSACVARYDLDRFPGEFYRRPVFFCRASTNS